MTGVVVARTLRAPCLDGRAHRYSRERYEERCVRCHRSRFDLRHFVGPTHDWEVQEYGPCDWCVEYDALMDLKREVDSERYIRAMEEARQYMERHRAREARRLEWQQQAREYEEQQRAKAETRRQRQRLEEGRRLLTAMRRHLAAPGRSPLPVSAPAMSSPT